MNQNSYRADLIKRLRDEDAKCMKGTHFAGLLAEAADYIERHRPEQCGSVTTNNGSTIQFAETGDGPYIGVNQGLAWLWEREFYELCQNYRHATDNPPVPTMDSTVEAFERLKLAIADAFAPYGSDATRSDG